MKIIRRPRVSKRSEYKDEEVRPRRPEKDGLDAPFLCQITHSATTFRHAIAMMAVVLWVPDCGESLWKGARSSTKVTSRGYKKRVQVTNEGKDPIDSAISVVLCPLDCSRHGTRRPKCPGPNVHVLNFSSARKQQAEPIASAAV